MKKLANYTSVITLFVLLIITVYVNGQSHNIKNDIFWDTKDGRPIYSQGGGVFKFADPVNGEKKLLLVWR
jgi:hypothetical protein